MSLGVASAVAPADAQHVPAQEAADTDTVEMGVVADTVAAGTVGDAVEQMALGRVLGMDYRDVEDQDPCACWAFPFGGCAMDGACRSIINSSYMFFVLAILHDFILLEPYAIYLPLAHHDSDIVRWHHDVNIVRYAFCRPYKSPIRVQTGPNNLC